MPYKVLHTLWSAASGFGSYPRFVSALAAGLDRQRYSIHGVFLSDDGPLIADLESFGCTASAMGWHGKNDLPGLVRVWRLLRSQDWAIIHLNAGGKYLRWLARQATRAKIVQHIWSRETDEVNPKPVLRRVTDADAVIATSRSVAEMVVGSQPHIVYPGVRVPHTHFPPVLSRSIQIVGTARRLVPSKGVIHLIRAIGLLSEEFPNLHLEIAGSGPEQAVLESEVRSLRLGDRVCFLGWRRDIEAEMVRWDVSVMPSLEEGFGIAALEAMAVGVPVIATAVGGVPEIINDGENGLLVPPADPQLLAASLRKLLLDPELSRRIGAAGRDRVRERFSTDQMVADISDIYDSILGKP